MKLVAVSMIKNEADMIEAFVRHTAAWVDFHLIFDHDSTDGTREILYALQSEGLPLRIFTDGSLGKLQQLRTNVLGRIAARELGADWIIPLDADEILSGPDRAALEKALAGVPAEQPASQLMLNFYPTQTDDPAIANPVLRLRHAQSTAPRTKKLLVPGRLLNDEAVALGAGNHTLQRGDSLIADAPLPAEFYLAHFPLRSPSQQIMRVTLAELQKQSRGRAYAGMDLHYRLGFQILAENPGQFLATVYQPAAQLTPRAATYRGGSLRYTRQTPEWMRVARALLPYFEKLAASHGELLDRLTTGPAEETAPAISSWRELHAGQASIDLESREAFSGFTPIAGLQGLEGPVPEAFLPVFRWATAPETIVRIETRNPGARLELEALTYCENQTMTVLLNGTELASFTFPRINQRERFLFPLTLGIQDNILQFRFSQSLESAADPRKLAVIFLGLRISAL